MMENKIEQENLARERQEKREMELQRARELVNEKRSEKEGARIKIQMVQERKKQEAEAIKELSRKCQKQIGKNEKKYLRRAQEKRFEQQVMMEAQKIKNEQFLVNRLSQQ